MRPRTLALAAGLAALAVRPACALVLPAGATADEDRRWEELSHQDARKLPAVVAVLKYAVGGRASYGTGTCIGSDREGKRGFILTAAHLFQSEDRLTGEESARRVQILFGPTVRPESEDKAGISCRSGVR
jgi:hypothetical protein